MANRCQDDMPLGPSRSELQRLVRFYSTREIAQRYEVGQTTVRKWCRQLSVIPPRCKYFPIHDL